MSVSLALSHTPVYTAKTTDTGYSASRSVPVYVPAFAGTHCAYTHEGMAKLSLPGWLVTYQDGLPACRWSPIQVLTGPGVD